MGSLTEFLRRDPHFARLEAALRESRASLSAGGVPEAARAFVLSAVVDSLTTPLLVIVSDAEAAETLGDGLSRFLPPAGRKGPQPAVCVFPPAEIPLTPEDGSDLPAARRRLAVLARLLEDPRLVVVAPIASLCQPTLPPELLRSATFTIRAGQLQPLAELVDRFVNIGLERVDTVERVGQFSVRGGVVDFFTATSDAPYRLELFGDEVESLRTFDLDTQKSRQTVSACTISPPREVVLNRLQVQQASQSIAQSLETQVAQLRRSGRAEAAADLAATVRRHLELLEQLEYFNGIEAYRPFLYPDRPTLVEYLPEQTTIVSCEVDSLRIHQTRIEEELQQGHLKAIESGRALATPTEHFVSCEELLARCSAYREIHLSAGSLEEQDAKGFELDFHLVRTFNAQLDELVSELRTWQQERRRILLSTNHASRVRQILHDGGLAFIATSKELNTPEPGQILIAEPPMVPGFVLPSASLAVVSDREIFGWTGSRRRRRRGQDMVALSAVTELNEGDYVVHINHGIGMYRGIERKTVQGSESEYLLIQYAEADRLYVPVHQIDRVQKYVGADGLVPTLHKLGGSAWETTKRRARKSTADIAKELMALHALRTNTEGYAFGPDTPWQRELEASFEYEETEDQWRAVEETKQDLEALKPMDRLICGDVGYGKTEVAIRAAFKVVQEGKQVAVLVPTTVLAQQHGNTFRERLGAYPVNTQVLSRFQSPVAQERILRDLRLGAVDLVIGTHRLLQKDVEFKDLGLVIVDEEHRFGVKQKELLKQLRTTVDVLALTATPIPRTLHMALGGVRDMSIINDPPEGRIAVRTYVVPLDDDRARQAIVRELERDGQVYYVHNRVESIYHVAEHVRRLVPSARIGIGHGQLPEEKLERVMLDFYAGKFDVLVCTTIIESGLDLPNANTLIVDGCDKLGLAQLYQLRGRVGRSNRQAYAYLFYGHRGKLTPDADRRLEALREFSDLGSGFKIALRDLEIRGAGNLLGAEQHGFMQAVGFEMYCDMLAEAVHAFSGKPVQRGPDLPEVDLPLAAYVPENYIHSLDHRIDMYRKMAAVRTEKDLDDVEAELRDRYGIAPIQATNMLRLLRLRLRCAAANLKGIGQQAGEVVLWFQPGDTLGDRQLTHLYARLRTRYSAKALKAVRVILGGIAFNPQVLSSQELLRVVEEVVGALWEERREECV